MYKITYNSNPNHPKHLNHIGAFSQLTEQDTKVFKTLDEAINFWFDCNSPITRLIDFKEDFMKQYSGYSESDINAILEISEAREEEITKEDLLINQSKLYSYEGD